MADLLEVAMSVYAADRLSRRSYRGMNTGHRQINIRVGVKRPRLLAPSGDHRMSQRLSLLAKRR